MKRILLLCAVLILGWTVANAQETTPLSRWEAAANAYSEGKWQQALDLYQALEAEGFQSAELDYNMANCYYKLGGSLGASILHYERALKQNPRFEDAAFNLALAQQQTLDRIDQIPEFVLVKVLRNIRQFFSADAWARASLVLFALGLVCLLGLRYGRTLRLRKTAFVLSVILVLFAIFAGCFGFGAKQAALRDDQAVVMATVSSVKSSPSTSGNNLFVLHEGTKVGVLETLGKWMRIELADGRQGWIQTQEAEII